MTVYAIQSINTYTGGSRVSSEAYDTIDKAQDFCIKRRNAEKVNDMIFKNGEYKYMIIPLAVV